MKPWRAVGCSRPAPERAEKAQRQSGEAERALSQTTLKLRPDMPTQATREPKGLSDWERATRPQGTGLPKRWLRCPVSQGCFDVLNPPGTRCARSIL